MFHVNVQSQLNCAGRKNSLVRKNSICEEDFLLGGRIPLLWKNSAFTEEFHFYGRISVLWKNSVYRNLMLVKYSPLLHCSGGLE